MLRIDSRRRASPFLPYLKEGVSWRKMDEIDQLPFGNIRPYDVLQLSKKIYESLLSQVRTSKVPKGDLSRWQFWLEQQQDRWGKSEAIIPSDVYQLVAHIQKLSRLMEE